MIIGLIGLPQVGKKTLFELITGHPAGEHDLAAGKTVLGSAEIADPRFDWLSQLYQPKKNVRARINVELIPNLIKGFGGNSQILASLNNAEALCHVVRAFDNQSVYHVSGSVDPKRDIAEINGELILNDLMFVEKRLERIDKDMKRNKEERLVKEKELLLRFKDWLDPVRSEHIVDKPTIGNAKSPTHYASNGVNQSKPLRLYPFTPEERKNITNSQMITLKEMIVVLNVSEDAVKDQTLVTALEKEYQPIRIHFMQVSAQVESEIAKLDSPAERKEFMESVGISEQAIDRLKRVCLKALNLIPFFTVGKDEVRQWLIKAQSPAPVAAGAIHTDLEKGFIRAETMKYDELFESGNEEKLHAAGKVYVKGKDYIVQDGDILNIRFNV